MSKLAIILCYVIFNAVADASSMKKIDESISEIEQELETHLSMFADSSSTIKNIKTDIQHRISRAKSKINSTISYTTTRTDGVDISDCIQNFNNNLNADVKKVILQTTQCAYNKVATTRPYIANITHLYEAEINRLIALRRETQNRCENSSSWIIRFGTSLCHMIILWKDGSISSEFVEDLAHKHADLESFLFEDFLPNLNSCTTYGMTTYREIFSTHAKEAKKCINHKFDAKIQMKSPPYSIVQS